MNVLSQIVGAGIALNRRIAGEAITYRRGGLSCPLTAKRRGGDRLEDRQGSVTLQTDEMEWLIARDELILGGVSAVPAKGDTIEWISNGVTKTYTVLPPEGMRQPWRWADRGETHYHAFTKLTSKS